MMKTKAVYIATSSDKDYFLEQMIISVYSLKLWNPSINVTLVTDNDTKAGLTGKRDRILEYVDEVIAVEIPSEFNVMQRSRYLKTSLRNLVTGDYLYIDTDTIITSSLQEIDNFTFDLGAVLDRHQPIHRHSGHAKIKLYAKSIGWDIPKDDRYFNGGLMYVKDSDLSRCFYEVWHKIWKYGIKNLNLSIDQPSLAKANATLNYPIEELDGTYNCQIIENGLKYFADAKIIHYFASNIGKWDCPYLFRNEDIYEKIREYGMTEEIKNMVAQAKSAFNENTLILAGNMCDAYNSTVVGFARRIHMGFPKFSKMLDRLYNRMAAK